MLFCVLHCKEKINKEAKKRGNYARKLLNFLLSLSLKFHLIENKHGAHLSHPNNNKLQQVSGKSGEKNSLHMESQPNQYSLSTVKCI